MEKSKLGDGEWVQLIGRLKKTPGIRVQSTELKEGLNNSKPGVLPA